MTILEYLFVVFLIYCTDRLIELWGGYMKALAYICYGIGHANYLICNNIPESCPDWTAAPFYRCYQKFMLWSSDLDTAGTLWKPPT